jgi:Protein of unknown function (DUF2933)
MSHHHDVDREPKREGSFLTSRAGIALLVLLAIAGFLLFTEHRAHVLGVRWKAHVIEMRNCLNSLAQTVIPSAQVKAAEIVEAGGPYVAGPRHGLRLCW